MLVIISRYAFSIVVLSFLLLGILGGFLLFLPGMLSYPVSFIDALFMSCSAIAGVGVSIFPIADFSLYGKIVLIFLMYVGSIGVLTIILAIIFYFTMYNVEWYGLARELFSIVNIYTIVSFFKIIFLVTLIMQIFGVVSYTVLAKNLGYALPFIDALFLSINLFSNVGFSLVSLIPDVMNFHTLFYCISIFLMIIGGAGFLLFFECKEYVIKKISSKPYYFSLTTKIIYTAYFGSILAMWLFYFCFCEVDYSLQSVIRSLFAAVSFRACGISPYLNLPVVFIFISSLYGILGTTPFGTGGGIKTSLFSIIVKTIVTIFQKKGKVIIFFRTISWQLVALAHIFLLYIIGISVFVSITISLYINNQIDFMLIFSDILGLITSSGALWTPVLQAIGLAEKIICIILMLLGKIAGIMLTFYIAKREKNREKYSEGKLILL